MMFVIRPIKRQDLDSLERFAFDSTGIMSLPKDRHLLEMKIEQSLLAFNTEIHHPCHENYLFALEDMESHQIGGVCGIFAKTGIGEPLYFYHIETLHLTPSYLPVPSEMMVLHPLSIQNGPTEIGSLYLAPEYRHSGLGRLLSLCRFLFMASFPQRFEEIIMAEMRGFIDENQNSPFWEGLGKHFLDLDFVELTKLLDQGKTFIHHILPHYPIYATFLPKSTQQSINRVHANTLPALNMLLQEGFFMTENIDLFDGGPHIRASREEIRTIQGSTVARITELTTNFTDSHLYIVCNDQLDFRACYAHLNLDQPGQVIVSKEVAANLQVKVGDLIRYSLAAPNLKDQP
jgi:arginine N-succinyltransferase